MTVLGPSSAPAGLPAPALPGTAALLRPFASELASALLLLRSGEDVERGAAGFRQDGSRAAAETVPPACGLAAWARGRVRAGLARRLSRSGRRAPGRRKEASHG